MGPTPADLNERAARLRHTHLFADLSPDDLRALAARCEERVLQPGEVAVRQGDPAEHLFVVTEGVLRASRRTDDGEVRVLGEIYKGSFFGEIALLRSNRRNATVEAASRCALLQVAAHTLHETLAGRPEAVARLEATIARRLKNESAPFRPATEILLDRLAQTIDGVTPEALRELEPELAWEWLPADTIVIRQDDPGDCLYLVLSGHLRVFVQRRDGTEITVGTIGSGEIVGELALLTGEPRNATVTTVVDTELLRLSRTGFDAIAAAHPGALRSFTRLIAHRLTRHLHKEDLRVRLRATPRVTVAHCERVVATSDLVLRNLQITQTYHRLAVQLTALLGSQDINWPAFGCHASKTVGYTIRREDLPLHGLYETIQRSRGLGRVAHALTRRVRGTALAGALIEVVSSASAAVSGGNLRIFGDMAPVFARFQDAFVQDAIYDAEKIAAFRATLVSGPSDQGGQDTLGRALGRYYEAAFCSDPKRRSELILLGNIEVGLHEQIRVQPDIEEALGAPLRGRLGDEFTRLLFDERATWLPERGRRLRVRSDRLEQRLLDALSGWVRRLLTRHQFALRLPGGLVRLGLDLPEARRAERFPEVLRDLEHPELVEVVARYDRTQGTGRGARALDWSRLDDRMNFIINLFRARQHDLALFTPPFQHGQVLDLAAGRVPKGRL